MYRRPPDLKRIFDKILLSRDFETYSEAIQKLHDALQIFFSDEKPSILLSCLTQGSQETLDTLYTVTKREQRFIDKINLIQANTRNSIEELRRQKQLITDVLGTIGRDLEPALKTSTRLDTFYQKYTSTDEGAVGTHLPARKEAAELWQDISRILSLENPEQHFKRQLSQLFSGEIPDIFEKINGAFDNISQVRCWYLASGKHSSNGADEMNESCDYKKIKELVDFQEIKDELDMRWKEHRRWALRLLVASTALLVACIVAILIGVIASNESVKDANGSVNNAHESVNNAHECVNNVNERVDNANESVNNANDTARLVAWIATAVLVYIPILLVAVHFLRFLFLHLQQMFAVQAQCARVALAKELLKSGDFEHCFNVLEEISLSQDGE